jgi:hypothetical protein
MRRRLESQLLDDVVASRLQESLRLHDEEVTRKKMMRPAICGPHHLFQNWD